MIQYPYFLNWWIFLCSLAEIEEEFKEGVLTEKVCTIVLCSSTGTVHIIDIL